METKYFTPTEGKDGSFYLRVIQPSKGVLGQLIERTGFLKFETEEEALSAFDKLENNEVAIKLGNKASNSDLYEIIPVAVEVAA